MRRHVLMVALSILALTLVFAANFTRPALAVGSQIRTFVSTSGSDANPCTLASPCRMFSAALAQTASGGEVIALNTGGYGTLTIAQSVTISAVPGVQAFIAPSTGAGITVDAGASDRVILRNLTFNSAGGDYGVLYVAAASLHIENVSINGFANIGIFMATSDVTELYVADTIVRNTGGSAIYVSSSVTYGHATIVRSRLENNNYGVFVAANAKASVRDTVASGHGGTGFIASSSSSVVELNLESCTATRNGQGISAGSTSGTAIVRASNCMVTDNGTGVSTGPNGSTLSRGNNTIEGNTINGTFSGPYTAK